MDSEKNKPSEDAVIQKPEEPAFKLKKDADAKKDDGVWLEEQLKSGGKLTPPGDEPAEDKAEKFQTAEDHVKKLIAEFPYLDLAKHFRFFKKMAVKPNVSVWTDQEIEEGQGYAAEMLACAQSKDKKLNSLANNVDQKIINLAHNILNEASLRGIEKVPPYGIKDKNFPE